jgi:hypothetical protein
LLEQIKEGAVDSTADLGEVLRRCLVLATHLGHAEFKMWVENELKGYKDDDDLPSYRVIRVNSVGVWLGRGMQARFPILPGGLPDKIKKRMATARLTAPIAVYESLVKVSNMEDLGIDWPDGWAPLAKGYLDFECIKAQQVVPAGALKSVVETVRAQILGFALDLEEENPRAGEAIGKPGVSPERVTQIYNMHFEGNVGNVASGSTNVAQSATIKVNVTTGDFASLAAFLRSQKVSEKEIKRLKEAVTAEPPEKHRKKFGPRVLAWIGEQTAKLALDVPPALAAELIVRALLAFYGHHPAM